MGGELVNHIWYQPVTAGLIDAFAPSPASTSSTSSTTSGIYDGTLLTWAMLEVIGEIAIQPRHRCHGCGADKPEILQGWSAEFKSRAVDDIMFVYLEHRFTPNFEVLETRITLRTIFRNDEGIPQDRDYRSVLVQSRVHAERLYPDTEGRNNVRYYRQPGSA